MENISDHRLLNKLISKYVNDNQLAGQVISYISTNPSSDLAEGLAALGLESSKINTIIDAISHYNKPPTLLVIILVFQQMRIHV